MDPSNFRRPQCQMVLPPTWRNVPSPHPETQRAYRKDLAQLFVIVGEECHSGEWWIHLSISGLLRLPTWGEINEAKNLFIGRDAKAIQIFPPDREKINIHLYCLHLWSNLESEILPDFRAIFDGEGI